MAHNKISNEQYAEFVRKGLIEITEENPTVNKPKPIKPQMIEYSFLTVQKPLKGTWMIPVRLESEANASMHFKGKMSRNKNVKNAIYKGLGRSWRIWGPIGDSIRNGKPCRIEVIRHGGRMLDTVNLWSSVKFVEDAIANMMGLDDGTQAWKDSFTVGQKPGPFWGVEIFMSKT